jgi:AcrR family transcriptional regulator
MKKQAKIALPSTQAAQPDHARKIEILERMTHLFAVGSSQQLSMRALATSVGVANSVLYYYFANKEELLKAMYEHNNRILGQARALLPESTTPREKLESIIAFQFNHTERVVAVLKYYFAYRQEFAEQPARTLPPKATQHIEEVLEFGIATGAYAERARTDAKVIAHIINGYLLELYPLQPSGAERTALIKQIADFIERSVSVSNTTTTLLHNHPPRSKSKSTQ